MMNNKRIARELTRIAKGLTGTNYKSMDFLSSSERLIAEKMMDKGYAYAVQIATVDGAFGDPLYFKSADDVGPFLRSFPDYAKAKIDWVLKLED